jgi:aryl-alcohol dehydrogenase-like predicted oxidoreductase
MREKIAIDPDVDKSGVALWKDNKITVMNMAFPDLLDYLQQHKDATVIVEGGWLNKKSNYHGGYGGVGQKIANGVGRNAEVGHKIVEMCEHYGIEVVIKPPLKKGWAGGKISHEEISRFIPDFPKRSNQETRDAALLLWDELGKPIRS